MKTEYVIQAVAVALILALAVGCGVMRYQECRTEHPWWYCLGQQ
jgi:hypothetical protein